MIAAGSDALAFMGTLVIEDGRFWAQVATDDQIADAAAILAGVPQQRRHWLGRARGYSKTTDLAAMTLAAMTCGVLPPGGRGYVCAADRDQAQLLVDAARGFVQRTPGLAQLFSIERWRIVGPNDTEVIVLAADGASAYGLRGHWWVVDELCQWTDTPTARDFFDAISTAWPKTTTGRVVIITTAGDPTHWAHDVYQHACTDPLWQVSELHGPPPWLDPADLDSERRRLPDALWRRLFLNEWAHSDDRLVDPADLATITRPDARTLPYDPHHAPYLITVDIGLTRDRTAVAVSHRDHTQPHRPVVVDQIRYWRGDRRQPVNLTEVTATIAELSRDYGGAHVIIDPYQAALTSQLLAAQHIHVDQLTFNAATNNELAQALYQAIRDHTLSLPADPTLHDELLHLRLNETQPGVWKIDHTSRRHDDLAIVTAMAIHWHQRHLRAPIPLAIPEGSLKPRGVGLFDYPGTRPW